MALLVLIEIEDQDVKQWNLPTMPYQITSEFKWKLKRTEFYYSFIVKQKDLY